MKGRHWDSGRAGPKSYRRLRISGSGTVNRACRAVHVVARRRCLLDPLGFQELLVELDAESGPVRYDHVAVFVDRTFSFTCTNLLVVDEGQRGPLLARGVPTMVRE